MKQGLKHLVECHCVLPQFRGSPNAVYHKFVVFSIIDDDDNVVLSHAQCNNCGVIHRIVDVCKSEIIAGRDTSVSILTIDDIKQSLHPNVVSVLETYAAPLATWQEAAFICQNAKWGSHVNLTSESIGDSVEGKTLIFTGNGSVKIEAFSGTTLFPG